MVKMFTQQPYGSQGSITVDCILDKYLLLLARTNQYFMNKNLVEGNSSYVCVGGGLYEHEM